MPKAATYLANIQQFLFNVTKKRLKNVQAVASEMCVYVHNA